MYINYNMPDPRPGKQAPREYLQPRPAAAENGHAGELRRVLGSPILDDTRFKGRIIKSEEAQYKVLDKMGEGGMSWVYLAEKIGASEENRTVAVKFLREDVDTASAELKERFTREYLILRGLDHPNIVKLLDFGIDSRMFIVMEHLVGETLAAELPDLERGAPRNPSLLNWENISRIMLPTCDGLAYAHGQKVSHRDIKPSNIFLVGRGGVFGGIKILDFGTAKVVGNPSMATLTHTGMVTGTPFYMPPETFMPEFSAESLARADLPGLKARLGINRSDRTITAEGVILLAKERLNVAKDVYAMGAVLYQLLTGIPPFYDTNPMALPLKIARDPIQPPSERVPFMRIPPVLDEVVLHAIDKDPFTRCGSISEFRSAIESITWDARGKKAFRGFRPKRNPAGLLLKVGAVAALAAGSIWMLGNQSTVNSFLTNAKYSAYTFYNEQVRQWLLQHNFSPPPEFTLPGRHYTASIICNVAGAKVYLNSGAHQKYLGTTPLTDPIRLADSSATRGPDTFIFRYGNQERKVRVSPAHPDAFVQFTQASPAKSVRVPGYKSVRTVDSSQSPVQTSDTGNGQIQQNSVPVADSTQGGTAAPDQQPPQSGDSVQSGNPSPEGDSAPLVNGQ
jgi:serine/threonine protein kinase